MDHRALGFLVIAVLYAGIGILAALGSISLTRRLSPKAEQIFYGVLLGMIAGVYLAFTAYFGDTTVWQTEWIAVLAFVALGLLGVRLPFALILGYPLHGLWDLVHEFQVHGVYSGFEAGHLTAIPLAYGLFCLAFDFFIAGYFYRRRHTWIAAWHPTH